MIIVIIVLSIALIYSWADRAIFNTFIEKLIYRTNIVAGTEERLQESIENLGIEDELMLEVDNDIQMIQRYSERGRVKTKDIQESQLIKLNKRIK